jgi:hypothetical protein
MSSFFLSLIGMGAGKGRTLPEKVLTSLHPGIFRLLQFPQVKI